MRRLALLIACTSLAAAEDGARISAFFTAGPGDTAEPPGTHAVVAELREVFSNGAAGKRLDEAYERLGRAARSDPDWRVEFARGMHQCAAILWSETALAEHVRDERPSPERIDEMRGLQAEFAQARLAEAHGHFRAALDRARTEGVGITPYVRLGSASMKMAGREYLRAKRDAVGAVEDFDVLARRGWQPELCRELAARCLDEAGRDAYAAGLVEDAHRHWAAATARSGDPALRRRVAAAQAWPRGLFSRERRRALVDADPPDNAAALWRALFPVYRIGDPITLCLVARAGGNTPFRGAAVVVEVTFPDSAKTLCRPETGPVEAEPGAETRVTVRLDTLCDLAQHGTYGVRVRCGGLETAPLDLVIVPR